MKFKYTGTFFIPEYILNEMAEEVAKGLPANIAVDDYAAGWDEIGCDILNEIFDEVVAEVERRAELIKRGEKNVD